MAFLGIEWDFAKAAGELSDWLFPPDFIPAGVPQDPTAKICERYDLPDGSVKYVKLKAVMKQRPDGKGLYVAEWIPDAPQGAPVTEPPSQTSAPAHAAEQTVQTPKDVDHTPTGCDFIL